MPAPAILFSRSGYFFGLETQLPLEESHRRRHARSGGKNAQLPDNPGQSIHDAVASGIDCAG
jgi:hypothetical protein